MTADRFPTFQELQDMFGEQVVSMGTEWDNQLYLDIGGPDVRGIVEHLLREHGARIVTVFAEDRRSREGLFFTYYVFEQIGNPQYLVLRAPVHPHDQEFPSLSAELPAVNWQEREMQDWFGLRAVGHPNPRRVAMHDNWPDVHPLRKDFAIGTSLPRFEGDVVCVGGVRRPWQAGHQHALRRTVDVFDKDFDRLIALIYSSDSTRDRLEHTGILRPEKARDLGIVGVGGRASGIDLDVRRDHPYAAYDRFSFRIPVYQTGDVWHRMQVRIDEVRESIRILRRATEHAVDGAHCAATRPIPPDRCALSAVEGWRGEIIHWVRTGPNNRLERCKVKDPSLNNWPALVEAVQGNIIADFPVINKSFNLSYSGTDR